MRRLLVAPAALGLVFAALACGGGSSGSVTYAPTVVQIRHIDFTGVELSADALFDPPPASLVEQFPLVVATVNGEKITGASVAQREILAAVNRKDPNLAELRNAGRGAVTHQDLLELLIDEVLQRQAIVRLGLLPSHEEAVASTEEQEKSYHETLAKMSPDQRAHAEETSQRSGFPATNWASSEKIVEGYRWAGAQGKLLHEYCDKLHTPAPRTSLLSLTTGGTCNEFLAKERENAKIVYYVRWAD